MKALPSAVRRGGLVLAFLVTTAPRVVATPPSSSVPGSQAHALALAVREELAARSVVASWTDGPTIPSEWELDDWDWVDRAPPGPPRAERSIVRAVAWSALLPGLGERYVGHANRARLFHVAEAVIWSAFAFYRIQGDIRENTQIEFAQLQAGAAVEQDRDYYEHIGFWLSLEEWYDIVRRDARFRFPDDPAAQEAFFEENKRFGEGQGWSWPDDETRTRYRQLRSRTERSYRNARLAVGAAIFNRLASMADALALARSHNRSLREEQARIELRFGPRNTVDGLVVGPVLTRRY